MSAGGWNSGPDREAMLRRVAIVLSSLPAPMASKLLVTLGADSEQAIRRTMTRLTDVDPLERQRAIQAFKITLQRQSVHADENEADTLQIGTSGIAANKPPTKRVVPSSQAPVVDRESPPASPLTFLGEVEASVLARLLEAEHPQTIAFVLASIAPDQAARVLPKLGPKLQSETMNRIGRLGEIPETAVAEVAEHFRSRLGDQPSSQGHSLGQKALNAILAAMPPQTGAAPGQPAERFQEGFSNGPASRYGMDSDRQAHDTASSPRTGSPAHELTQRLRVAEGTWPEGEFARPASPDPGSELRSNFAGGQPHTSDHAYASTQDRSMAPRTPGQPADAVASSNKPRPSSPASDRSGTHGVLTSTDNIHRHLIGLRPVDLCRALGQVDTRDAMLALCGLPVQVTNAALAILPRSQAKTVRNKMNSLGSLNLREIDRAKEKVAEASLGPLPSPALSRAAA